MLPPASAFLVARSHADSTLLSGDGRFRRGRLNVLAIYTQAWAGSCSGSPLLGAIFAVLENLLYGRVVCPSDGLGGVLPSLARAAFRMLSYKRLGSVVIIVLN